jgi:lipid-A-disaccharide synthase
MKKLLIIAGEASGEKHAADLVHCLKQYGREMTFFGIGGDAMAKEGVSLLYHIRQLSVLGIAEVIRHLPLIRRVQRDIKAALSQGVDAVILVDYPGFNLRIARMAKSMGIPVIYYISPQLWAWGEKRVGKIRRDVDLLLVLFRFEVDFYAAHDIEAHFVGHPLVDQVQIEPDIASFRIRHGLPDEKPLLGLFPGSREMEVRKLLPVMVKAARLLEKKYPLTPVLGCASQLPESLYRETAGEGLRMITGASHVLMKHSHCAIVASGTATLELGYLQTPMTVLYAVSPLTYWLGKRLVKIDTIALANIVAGEKVVPELIQHAITPESVFAETARYFEDPAYYRSVKDRLGRIAPALGAAGASRRAAEKILAFLNRSAAPDER